MALITPTKVPHANFSLYYAGTRTKYAEEALTKFGYCRLMSYVNERTHIQKHCQAGRKVFVDSGAFSATTRGIKINVDEYIDWLNQWSANMEKFCCWDSIGLNENEYEECAKKTWENYLYMYERVNEPHKLVYVYHYGEPIGYLHKALEFGCKLVALGGIAKRPRQERTEFFESVKDEFKKYPDVHVHAFGMTDAELLKKYTFIHGADSTSWLWPAKFSETEHKCKSKVYWSDKNPEKPNHVNNVTDETYFNVEDEIAEYGFKMEDLYGAEDGIKNRDMWQIMYWNEKFIPVRGGYFTDSEGNIIE